MSTAVMSMSVSNELQGIGSVLGSSDYQRSKTAASLRRTLSADMSSNKWLAKNGFCPLKKIASSEDLQFDDKTKKEEEPPGQTDIWSSIMTQKSSSSAPTPYVHPLAKRARSLSQQSLEICTESLGSETGSDGFSSVPPSETSDDEEEEVLEPAEEVKEIPIVNKQEVIVVNYNSHAIKKSPSRSFPPPLPSLSHHMRSHRVNGRLVVEAIPAPAPTPNYFQAQREGGRLLLTLANPKCNELTNTENTKEVTEEANKLKTKSSQKDEEAMFQEEEDEDNNEFEEEEEDEEEGDDDDEEEIGQVMDRGIVLEMKVGQPTKILPTGVINVHRSAIMVNKLMGLTNTDPSWSPKLEKMGDQTPLAQSLPPSQLVSRLIPSSAAASFNTYDYCWRTKSPGAAAPTVCTHPLTQNPPTITKNNNFLMRKNMNPQDLVLMRGNKADYLVPVFKGCKEPRRSLLVWEPYCIATS